LLDKINATCARLLDFPMLGPPREQLAPGLRVTFQGNYGIYYVLRDHEVIIVRVLHSARDVTAIAEQGGFSLS
jgi:toxin ParE1/3/4